MAVHRQAGSIRDTLQHTVWGGHRSGVLRWTPGAVFLVNEHWPHARSVTVLADETVPPVYYFARNRVLVPHTLLLKF